jgi:hypothetical protein
MPRDERERLPALVPSGEVVRVVLDLVAAGTAGEVVELPGSRGSRPHLGAPPLAGEGWRPAR